MILDFRFHCLHSLWFQLNRLLVLHVDCHLQYIDSGFTFMSLSRMSQRPFFTRKTSYIIILTSLPIYLNPQLSSSFNNRKRKSNELTHIIFWSYSKNRHFAHLPPKILRTLPKNSLLFDFFKDDNFTSPGGGSDVLLVFLLEETVSLVFELGRHV